MDWLQATYQPVTIYTDPSICFFAPQNWEILMNVSFGECAVVDRVISPDRVRATLPIDIQVTLPAHFQVNKFAVILPGQVWAILPNDVQMTLPAHFRVDLYT